MDKLIEFLTSEEMIIVGAIALVAGFFILLVYLFEKTYYKRKQKQNTKELNNLVVEVEKASEEKDNKIKSIDNVEEIEKEEKPSNFVEEIKVEPSVAEVSEEISPEVIPIAEKIDTAFIKQQDDKKDEVKLKNEEKQEEKPLVIPIEEFNENEANDIEHIEEKTNDIEHIYSSVKEEIESLEPENVVEEIVYGDVELKPEEAREELRKVTEDLMKKEEEAKALENIELTKFEEEQEENAIISLDELMKKSGELYEKNEATQYVDEGNEPISLQDLELRMNNIKEEIKKIDEEDSNIKINEVPATVSAIDTDKSVDTKKIVLDDFDTITDPDKIYRDDVIFKSSPIISPIFGIEQKAVGTNDLALENTANYDKLDQEIKKTNEFLVTLKELQKKLD